MSLVTPYSFPYASSFIHAYQSLHGYIDTNRTYRQARSITESMLPACFPACYSLVAATYGLFWAKTQRKHSLAFFFLSLCVRIVRQKNISRSRYAQSLCTERFAAARIVCMIIMVSLVPLRLFVRSTGTHVVHANNHGEETYRYMHSLSA